MSETTMLRLPAVMAERGRGKASTYVDVKNGLLTQPVKCGAKAVAWPAGEVRQINLARIAGKSDDEIRSLVSDLHAARKAAR